MTTKTLTGAYPGGYYLNPAFTTLKIATTASVGGPGVTTAAAHASTVNNYGTVAGGSNGIALSDGGRVVNGGTGNATATVRGVIAIEASGASATVLNGAILTSTTVETVTGKTASHPGTYHSALGATVVLGDGGVVTNTVAGAKISNGVEISAAAGTVSNRGTIGGEYYSSTYSGSEVSKNNIYQYGYSVTLGAGGYVNNGANGNTAAIISQGVTASGGVTNIVNNATIGATGETQTYVGYGSTHFTSTQLSVALNAGGTVTNGTGTDFTASLTGEVRIAGGQGVVVNHGSIGALANNSAHNGYKGHGTLTSVGVSIFLEAGGSVANGTAAHSAAIAGCIDIAGGVGTISNFGSIGAVDNRYVYSTIDATTTETRANSITLGAGGTVNNASASASLASGIQASGSAVVINQGTIGGGYQLNEFSRGSIYTKTTITKGVSVELLGGGTVTNGSATDATATISQGILIESAGGTVINFGVIGAPSVSYSYASKHKNVSTYSAGYAVDISGGRLVEEGSGKILGKASGNGGVLELGAAAGAGTIAGIGVSITNFATVTVDAGAGWHLAGSNTINNKSTLTNAAAIIGDGTVVIGGTANLGALVRLSTGAAFTVSATGHAYILGNTGITAATGATGTRLLNNGLLEKVGGTGVSNLIAATITNGGTIQVDQGTLNVQGSVNGVGQIVIGAGATLDVRNSMTSAGKVKFNGAGVAILNDVAAFKASIAGFGTGDVMDLTSVAFSSKETVAYSGTTTAGTLTVTSGATVAKIAMLGQFAAANFALKADGHGGTDVTFVAAPTVPALARPSG